MKKNDPRTLTSQLRQAVAECGMTLGELSRATGVDKSALSRFLNGERGVSCAVMDTLGEYLGLRLVKNKPRKAKGG